MSLLAEFAAAIEKRDSHAVESMLKSGSFDINAPLPLKSASPALVLAADRGFVELVELLLNAGAQIDVTDESGRTACHVAARNGHNAVVELLIARHADLTLTDVARQTAFDVAIAYCNHGISAMLLKAGQSIESDDLRCPEIAALSTDMIKAMLRRGFDVSQMREENGASPLHFASCGQFKPAVLDMLVNVCGCDVNARDGYGNTSAHVAAISGCHQQLRWLIAAGADVLAVSGEGHTLLHNACTEGSTRCVLLILAAGVDVLARNERGKTAAHLATMSYKGIADNTLSIAHHLLAAGASIDDPNPQSGVTVRQELTANGLLVDTELETARRQIAKERLDFVRERALQVCIGLQARGLDALVLCEILQNACGPVAPQIPFHHWWKIATTVKHHRRN